VSADNVLGLTASSETWVSVRDASGKVLVNRALSAGDALSTGAGGTLPLAVVIGRKNAVTVTVRGQPFDHKRGASDVARFTVE
jgi:cytoskeleton protein RodZ